MEEQEDIFWRPANSHQAACPKCNLAQEFAAGVVTECPKCEAEVVCYWIPTNERLKLGYWEVCENQEGEGG